MSYPVQFTELVIQVEYYYPEPEISSCEVYIHGQELDNTHSPCYIRGCLGKERGDISAYLHGKRTGKSLFRDLYIRGCIHTEDVHHAHTAGKSSGASSFSGYLGGHIFC